jgi:hypothetical protein
VHGGRESKSDARCGPVMKPREGNATSADPNVRRRLNVGASNAGRETLKKEMKQITMSVCS